MIVFRNPGVIDPRSITTFGTSSKDDSSKAIGYFGTGLKYAIAVLLREGCGLIVHSGGAQYTFTTQQTKIRNDEFQIVHMNGQPLGFTTELGKDWKLWMAYRELYCNAMDENGDVRFWGDEQKPCGPDETVILVTGAKFEQVHAERAMYCLSPELQPLFQTPNVQIFSGSSNAVFYKGIRAYELPGKSLFTYNILQKMDLTEDRTLKNFYYANYVVRDAVQACTNVEVARSCMTASDEVWEHQFDFRASVVSSPEFMTEARRLVQSFHPHLNRSVVKMLMQHGVDLLEGSTPAVLDPLDQKRLLTAISFCEKIGFNVSRYPVVVSQFLGSDVLGCAHKDTIYLSERVFHSGTKMVVGTLIEEFLHLSTQCEDCTRTMQNILIDRIVSIGERLTKKAL